MKRTFFAKTETEEQNEAIEFHTTLDHNFVPMKAIFTKSVELTLSRIGHSTWVIMFFCIAFGLSSSAQYTKLFDFNAISYGRTPNGSLISDGAYLYGMTSLGGANGYGTLFKVMANGSNFAILLNFSGVESGREPVGSLYYDGSYLYGVTQKGGTKNFGTVFKIKPDGTNFEKLRDFTGMPDGWRPKFCTLCSDGLFLYGTTVAGGTNDKGAIFKINKDGSEFSLILNFDGAGKGENPYGSLIFDGTYLYGMTEVGGSKGVGTIFKVLPDGSDYVKLHDFNGATDGSVPEGSLYFDGTYLFGMTSLGGAKNKGVIFKIKADGTEYTKLLDFDGTLTGGDPFGTLTPYGAFLYGLASDDGTYNAGTLFRIKPDGSEFSTLVNFNPTDGTYPFGSLLADGSWLYGMASNGGTYGGGTIFKFKDITTTLNEKGVNNLFDVYPNPSMGKLMISVRHFDKKAYPIEIYHVLGQLVFRSTITNQQSEIDLSQQSKGVYFVKVFDGETNHIHKMVLK